MATIAFTAIAGFWWAISLLYATISVVESVRDKGEDVRSFSIACVVTFLCGCAAWALR